MLALGARMGTCVRAPAPRDDVLGKPQGALASWSKGGLWWQRLGRWRTTTRWTTRPAPTRDAVAATADSQPPHSYPTPAPTLLRLHQRHGIASARGRAHAHAHAQHAGDVHDGHGTLKMWDVASATCQWSRAHGPVVVSMAWAPNGWHVASGSCIGKSIRVWETRHFRRVPQCLLRQRVSATFAVPTGGTLLYQDLMHFVYGCNDVNGGAVALRRLVLPDELFKMVCLYMTG